MRGWMIGACAVLTAAAAQAEDGREPYATIGAWEVEIETARKLCKMYRFYGNDAGNQIEGLIVRYDVTNEVVSLTWTTDRITDLPAKGQLDLQLSFVKGRSLDEWGRRTFQYERPAGTSYFSHVFTGAKASRRILRALGGSDTFGLELGPALLTGLSLDAAEAIAKLRECALQRAGRDSADPTLD